MQFSDVLGQQPIKDKLVQLVQHNRLSHALLFLGKEGSGALSLALAFAQYIVCTSAKEQAVPEGPSLFGSEPVAPTKSNPDLEQTDSCGICAACQKANKLVHPDIHFSFPVITKKSTEAPISSDYMNEWREFIASYPYGNVYDWLQSIGAENKQGNITKRECEDINKKLSLKSFESKYKILIMWLPEYLGKEGNRLLKLIEEPPPNTIFIFVAQDENVILPTILSRTQLIKIPQLSHLDIESALVSRAGANEKTAKQLSGLAGGNYREALQLLQHAEEDWQEVARDWLKFINRQQIAEQIKWIDDMSKMGREKQKQFLLFFIHLLEQAIRLEIVDEDKLSNNEDSSFNISEMERDFGVRLNKLCSLEAQEAIIDELNKACYYIERNANPKILFHALSIRLFYIIKDNSLILIN